MRVSDKCTMGPAGRFSSSAFIISAILSLNSQITFVLSSGLGRCPKYPPLPGFNISKFTGQWYEVERSFYFMEISASCTNLNISLNEKEHLAVQVSTVNRWTNHPSTSYGVGIPTFNGSSIFRYKLSNRLPYVISRMLPGAGMYNILFTDYDNFAVLWSCSSITIAYADQIWLLGRKRDISADLRAQIYRILGDLNLDHERLIVSKNSDCKN